jgi:CheY-like chemotaxis protein
VILVVDDDADIRSAIGEVLSSEGFQMAFASNGREALDVIEIGPEPDLILLDWLMPVMDGEQLLAKLDANPATAEIPLIVFTALASRAKARNRRVMRKPIDLEELVWTVVEMCPPLPVREFAGDEPSTDRLSSIPPLRLEDAERTAREDCAACGKRAAARCGGCGEAYCQDCFRGVSEPAARCDQCRARRA